MDKRLELTEKQKEIIGRYEEVVKEMRQANIKAIHMTGICGGSMFVINGENVDEFLYEDEMEDGHLVDDAELTQEEIDGGKEVLYEEFLININDVNEVPTPDSFTLTYGIDNSFGVRMKRG